MWTLGLLKTMKDPKYIVHSDQKVVMIKDVYPKAKHHYLVISQEEIAGIKDVKLKHLPLLEHMEKIAQDYTKKTAPGIQFKFGYHSKPSMHRLHLHVISTDMQSPALKTKKHWNSFTTEFFLNSKDIISELKADEKISIPGEAKCENLLNRNLKCNQCDKEFPNMPKLKAHLFNCVINLINYRVLLHEYLWTKLNYILRKIEKDSIVIKMQNYPTFQISDLDC